MDKKHLHYCEKYLRYNGTWRKKQNTIYRVYSQMYKDIYNGILYCYLKNLHILMVNDFQNMWRKQSAYQCEHCAAVCTTKGTAIHACICSEYLWNYVKETDNSSCLWGRETGERWEAYVPLYTFLFVFKFFSVYFFKFFFLISRCLESHFTWWWYKNFK